MSAYSTRTEHLATGQNLDRWITTLHQVASARASQPLPPPHEWVRDYWPGRNVFVNDIQAVLLRGTRISDDDLRSLINTLNDIAFIYRIKSTSPAAIRKGRVQQAEPVIRPRRTDMVDLNSNRLKYQVYVVLQRTMGAFSASLGYEKSTPANWMKKGKCPAQVADALGITIEQLNTRLDKAENLKLRQAIEPVDVKRRITKAIAAQAAAA